jgi:hypothetical protein
MAEQAWLYEVTLPTGCTAGDTFQVDVGGVLYDVTASEDCGAGCSITTFLPVERTVPEPGSITTFLPVERTVPEPDGRPTSCEVEVPTGCCPGAEFLVETLDGLTLSVLVPDDCSPGTMLQVSLPRSVDRELETSPMCVRALISEEVEATPAQTTRQRESKGFVGRMRNIVAGSDNSTTAEVASSDACMPSVHPDMSKAGRRDEFCYDDSYLIQRSDGSYSEGWIQEYDESCSLYRVLIVGVGYKYVAREQIELNTVHF